MSDSIKQIRGQVRQIVKEILPALLAEEFAKALHTGLQRHMDERLDAISKHIKATLDSIDTRSKETQSYVIRNSAPPAPPTARSLE